MLNAICDGAKISISTGLRISRLHISCMRKAWVAVASYAARCNRIRGSAEDADRRIASGKVGSCDGGEA